VKTHAWRKTLMPLLAAIWMLALSPWLRSARAQGETSPEDAELARAFAPVLYFHPSEIFRPQSVEVLVDTARLRQARRNWFDVNVRLDTSIADLFDCRDDSYALDAWYGSSGASDYKNYSAHRSYYRAALSPEAGGPPIVAYAHVVRDENPQYITIQYWLFYYYNDWFNKHEGDWEMVQVVLSAAGEPLWTVLSQHHGGTRRSWSATQVEGGTHPAVYVALGSHANYFWGDETYPNGTTIGNARLEIMDRTGTDGRVIPEVVLIPSRKEIDADPVVYKGLEWLLFGGHWGERAVQSDFGGPLGPAEKGEQWQRPYAWGMAQPLDVETWYRNRLRVAVLGEAAQRAQVTLLAPGQGPLPAAETIGHTALLHADPPSSAAIVAEIEATPQLPFRVVAAWPDGEAAQVTWYSFDPISSPSGRASLTLEAGSSPALIPAPGSEGVQPSGAVAETATWDAPDLAWLVGVLPASDVVKGVTMSLLAGLLPTLLYVGLLYWADRFEKEPTRLLAAAFLWGAIPALLVALGVQIFFKLPPDLLGPVAVEAVRAGLLAPLVEEAIKGIALVYIAIRYRAEFDNVLDGIIYGAIVGFGFAMTGNTLSYLGAFLLHGFAGLGSTVFLEGVVYGLNHALYAAVFGAGLGYARLARAKWQRWSVPLGAFLLAVVGNGLHSLAIQDAVGLSPLTVIGTWVGVLVIVGVIGWSLQRERQCLATELAGEVPEEVYRALTLHGGRSRAQWQELRRRGVRGWRQARHLHQLCAELAFKKMQHRRRPEEPGLAEEIRRLREQMRMLLA
jgi:RsiW-degrading membrane proteinase PrsW (M82 family)